MGDDASVRVAAAKGWVSVGEWVMGDGGGGKTMGRGD